MSDNRTRYPGKDASAAALRTWLYDAGWDTLYAFGVERWKFVNPKNQHSTETSFEGAIGIQRRRESSTKKHEALQARFDRLLAFVRDLAVHGTRFDMNPTLMTSDPVGQLHGHIKQIDDDVRHRAAEAVAEASKP